LTTIKVRGGCIWTWEFDGFSEISEVPTPIGGSDLRKTPRMRHITLLLATMSEVLTCIELSVSLRG
jgi:hypothetical protein